MEKGVNIAEWENAFSNKNQVLMGVYLDMMALMLIVAHLTMNIAFKLGSLYPVQKSFFI